jgi:putative ABC transport system permease protein
LASFKSLEIIRGNRDQFYRWGNNFHDTYLLLHKDADTTVIENKLKKYDMTVGSAGKIWSFHIWPLQDIHFKGIGNRKGESDIRYIYIFSAVALFLMFLACFNYMNLSTAQSATRAKEIGVRKVAGASRSQLIKQFLGESLLFSFTAFIFSIFLVYMLLPVFSVLIGDELSFSLLNNSWVLPGLLAVSVLIGLLSGSYPAFLISSYNPVSVVKGHVKSSPKRTSLFRNTLVTTQFVISIVMIVCTAVVYMQLNFIRNAKLGYNKEYVITMPLRVRGNYSPFKNELEKNPKIQDITVSQFSPNDIRNLAQVYWEGKDPSDLKQIRYNGVDHNYVDFYQMEIIKGRDFSKGFTTDLNGAFLLNETAVKEFGFENPIGKKIRIWGDEGKIVGVIKNFHSASMHLNIEPVAFRLSSDRLRMFSMKISSDDIPKTLAFLENIWKKFSPEYPFEYSFLDQEVDRMYRIEQRIGASFLYFTIIAIFIACLGLFGLVSFSAERRTKEIGIRKVLGAKISNIAWLVSKEFLLLVIVANIIAWPLAYYFMNKWLYNFAYRIDIGLGIFLASGMIALVIALLTVGYRSVKTATANPVDSLRYE